MYQQRTLTSISQASLTLAWYAWKLLAAAFSVLPLETEENSLRVLVWKKLFHYLQKRHSAFLSYSLLSYILWDTLYLKQQSKTVRHNWETMFCTNHIRLSIWYEWRLPLTGPPPPAPATLPGLAPDFSFQNDEDELELLEPPLLDIRGMTASSNQSNQQQEQGMIGPMKSSSLSILLQYCFLLMILFTVLRRKY